MTLGLPSDLTWYKLLTDWGSIIGGVFALVAGILAYIAGIIQANATQRAANSAARKDRLQAHNIAVGIYPEILAIKVACEKTTAYIASEFSKKFGLTQQAVYVIKNAAIAEPPLINRSLDNMYILEEAGASILQLYSVLIQFNTLVGKIANQAKEDINSFDPYGAATALSGHLRAMERLVREAEQQIAPIHDAKIT